ncbi:MAG: 16S rRNA (cytosine(1402)-N(4))-methyltransferase, partial [Myxococcota bacterium]
MTSPSSASDAHVSVLAPEVVDALVPALKAAPSAVIVDATTGLGGHTLRLLEAARPQMAVAFDRDADALAMARVRLADAPCPVHFVHAPFSSIKAE